MADADAVVRLPRPLVEEIDQAAAAELRSRSNYVKLVVTEALRRRETQDVKESR